MISRSARGDTIAKLYFLRLTVELCLELRQSVAERMIKKLGRAVIEHLVAAIIVTVLEASGFLPILRQNSLSSSRRKTRLCYQP